MLEVFALFILLAALALLIALSIIDLRVGLLPNKLVFPFALLGVAFHACLQFRALDPFDMAIGALIGGGLLYLVRLAAMRFYGPDALGLGDVKLMAAAGLWLGPTAVSAALAAGALAGIVHGLGAGFYRQMKTGVRTNFAALSIPAGPGFIAGIMIAAGIYFNDLPAMIWR